MSLYFQSSCILRAHWCVKRWKGNLAEVNMVNVHGSQSEAGTGNGSHHGQTHRLKKDT